MKRLENIWFGSKNGATNNKQKIGVERSGNGFLKMCFKKVETDKKNWEYYSKNLGFEKV